MSEQVYIYRWGTNPKQRSMKGRKCVVLQRGRRNNCCVKFLDNNQVEIVSRWALRQFKENSEKNGK